MYRNNRPRALVHFRGFDALLLEGLSIFVVLLEIFGGFGGNGLVYLEAFGGFFGLTLGIAPACIYGMWLGRNGGDAKLGKM